MSSADSFEILAEVAIGLAGFGSIAIVLGRDRNEWESADFFRTASLFLTSLGALFLALLPIGLSTTQMASESIWRISSVVMLVYVIVLSILGGRMRRRYLDRELWLGPVLISLLVGTTMATALAQLLNATGILFEPSATSYFFGVVWLLLYGCMLLMRIVFVRPNRG